MFTKTKVFKKFTNIYIILFLVIFTLVFAKGFINFSIAPFEDAAILMRYAQHFGEGFGIVWNIGDKPIDGATDFLFMVVVGLLVKLGLSLELSTRMIGFISHILTVVIVYIALRDLYKSQIIPALLSALYLAVGPGLYYVAAYFGTPFFALFGCITWWIALKLIVQNNNSQKLSLLFSVSSLITGLIRPEGVFLVGFMMLSIVYFNGMKKSYKPILYFIGIFLLIGSIYFIWRWHYFGYPLPNPFYKKGGGYIHLSSLKMSIFYTTILCLPFIPAFILGLRSPKILRRTIRNLIPIVGFTVIFALISNEMNFGARFQYVLLPICLISWYPLVKDIRRDFHFQCWKEMDWYKRLTIILFLTIFSLGVVGYQYYLASHFTYYRDGRYEVACMLNEYSNKGYIIATTEAGILPLYSRWKTVDTWGLNDQWIAHSGGITNEYLDRYKPQIIMFHGYFSPLIPPPQLNKGGPWSKMTITLMNYAEENNYILAAVFGYTPYDTHYYYFRPNFTESGEIIEKLRSIKYYWWGNGRVAINFALP